MRVPRGHPADMSGTGYASLLVLLLAAAAGSAVVDAERAEAVVAGRLEWDGQSDCMTIGSTVPVYSPGEESPAAFLVSLDPTGYFVVCGDDRLEPVLAYSYENRCCPPGKPSGPMIDLVTSDLHRRIEHAGLMPEDAVRSNRALWEQLETGGPRTGPLPEQWPPAGSTPTGGWLEENWTQNAPYNTCCPMDLIAGQRSVAGCPAVAMGSILHFHAETNGTRFDDGDDYYHNYHEYYWIDDDHQAHDFPSWGELNGLLDTLEAHYASGAPTIEDRAALVYASGAACKQVYTASVSGTFGVGQAYDAYLRFGFDRCELLFESSDSLLERMSLNMMDAMPVHLAIVDEVPQYGHNLVVDGYSTDGYFHLNFGWGGSANGWYSFPLSGMPYGMNYIEGVLVDIGESSQSAEEGVAPAAGVLSVTSLTNPSASVLVLGVSSDRDCRVSLLVYSLNGSLAKATETDLQRGETVLALPLNDLPSGVYVLRIRSGSRLDSALFTIVGQ
ncbi:MAG: hypothetical protein AVO35_05805 [Candidatus Aegiribacteria sp. MLS_C]|nr:MAG: hypothetical protein AVO35_05805 [Candidatus Aegiribacteria sp. MLS_C]